MEKSKVYFTDFRTRLGEGLPSKLPSRRRQDGQAEAAYEGGRNGQDRHGRQVCCHKDALR